jgi:hypothetical protein
MASGSAAAEGGYQRTRWWVDGTASSTITATDGSSSAPSVQRFTQRLLPVYCMMKANQAGGSRPIPSHLASPQNSLVGSLVAPSSMA